jgi:hypothetical protein
MSKEKKPRKPKTQPKTDLVPVPPPLPERVPQRPALFRFIQGLRQVAGALLDLADGVADAITRRVS